MVAQDTRVPGWLLEVRTREITSRSHAVTVAGSPGKTVEHDPSPKTSAVSEIRPRETTSRCSRTVPVAGSSKEAVEHGRTVLPKHSSTVGVPPRSRAVSVADSSKEMVERFSQYTRVPCAVSEVRLHGTNPLLARAPSQGSSRVRTVEYGLTVLPRHLSTGRCVGGGTS